MDLKEFKQKHQQLMSEAKDLLKQNKIEEARAKRKEIEKLDEDFHNIAVEFANLRAMEDKSQIVDISNKGSKVDSGKILDSTLDDKKDKKNEIYKNAWAKDMMGIKMTSEESEVFKSVNEFTHTTGNTGIVIPETVSQGIWKEIGEQYPLWEDVFKTHVKGNLALIKSTASSKTKWYKEETQTEDGKETFGKATLAGCELSRDITVSWKLKEMAIEEFIPFIQSRLAEEMGAALGYGVAEGAGKSVDDSPDEPRGIITALKAENSKPQIIEYDDSDPISYKKCTSAMALIKGAYKKGACIYADGVTIWNELANIVDKNGRPYFVADATSGGVGRIFGLIVKEDDGMPTGSILFGNANKGYHANINKQILLDSEDHKKKRETDYIAYGIIDGDVRTTKAFSLIQKKSL